MLFVLVLLSAQEISARSQRVQTDPEKKPLSDNGAFPPLTMARKMGEDMGEGGL